MDLTPARAVLGGPRMKTPALLLALSASLALASDPRPEPVAGEVQAHCELVSRDEDRAGPWDVFEPGRSRCYGIAEDWGWELTLTLPAKKRITSMWVVHDILGIGAGEGWSTSRSEDNQFQKSYYPLVIFHGDRQVNRRYDQELGVWDAGTHVLRLYGQMEADTFAGAELTIFFDDGTRVVTRIPPPD
jgi:hypothetical protein